MAISTSVFELSPDSFSLVAEDVTSFLVTSKSSWYLHIYITAPGGDAPDDDSPYQEFNDKKYEYIGGPADVYMRSTNGEVRIGVVSQ